jgi:hypothetical protein
MRTLNIRLSGTSIVRVFTLTEEQVMHLVDDYGAWWSEGCMVVRSWEHLKAAGVQ